MGQDLDVCSKDNNIDDYFWDKHGSKDESTMQFFRRNYNKFVDSLISPERMLYNDGYLTRRYNNIDIDDYFSILEFKVFSQEKSLHACLWKYKDDKDNSNENNKKDINDNSNCELSHPVCILYLHNNTRCVADAVEVIPLAHYLHASVLSLDLPGCGKSEGCLSATIANDISYMIEWAKCLITPDVQVIVWGRGMSCAPVMEFCAHISQSINTNNRNNSTDSGTNRNSFITSKHKLSKNNNSDTVKENNDNPNNNIASSIKAVILDSPFIGIEQIVVELVRRTQTGIVQIPKTVIRACSKMVIHSLSKRLGGIDPFKIRPIDIAHQCHIPCVILAALEDDYIPSMHGQQIAMKWGGPVHLEYFHGKQFDERSPELIMSTVNFIRMYIETNIDTTATISSNNMKQDPSQVASVINDSLKLDSSEPSTATNSPQRSRNNSLDSGLLTVSEKIELSSIAANITKSPTNTDTDIETVIMNYINSPSSKKN